MKIHCGVESRKVCVYTVLSTQLGVQRLCRRLLHSAHFVYFANLTNEQRTSDVSFFLLLALLKE
jgi:hypothetical protein